MFCSSLEIIHAKRWLGPGTQSTHLSAHRCNWPSAQGSRLLLQLSSSFCWTRSDFTAPAFFITFLPQPMRAEASQALSAHTSYRASSQPPPPPPPHSYWWPPPDFVIPGPHLHSRREYPRRLSTCTYPEASQSAPSNPLSSSHSSPSTQLCFPISVASTRSLPSFLSFIYSSTL